MPNPFYAKAARYCASRERCRTEVLKKLRDWGDPKPETTLKQLQNEGYQNEARFSAAFVHDKFHLEGWGPHKIRAALISKQIEGSVLQKALQQIDLETERQSKKKWALKKFQQLKPEQKEAPIPYLLRFLQQKGFETEEFWNEWKGGWEKEANMPADKPNAPD